MKDDQITIADIHDGDEFVGFYVLKRSSLKESDGLFRLEIELSDKTGVLPGVVWEDAQTVRDQLSKGEVVKVKGRLGSYKDKPQARIDKIRPAEEGEYQPDLFIPSTTADCEALAARISEYIEGLGDTHLKQLGKLIFNNSAFMKEFKRAPGGSQWHHSCIGGLIEHSVAVADICNWIASKYPALNRDLLILAALLHDVGKIKELSAKNSIEYSDEGRLEGHLVMGDRFVRNMTDRIKDFPPRLKTLISHLMLSHHGFHTYSSPVEPMTREAFILYYADEIDAKLNALQKIVDTCGEEGKEWSDFNRILNRYIYAGEKGKKE
jgi:3'-5' exoribonuclease